MRGTVGGGEREREIKEITVLLCVQALSIADTLRALSEDARVQVIVVDGGSRDNTLAQVREFPGVEVYTCPSEMSCRALCQNIGAFAAFFG